MIKLSSIILCVLFLTTAALSAQNAHEPRAEQQATEMLTRASEKVKSFTSMEIEFSYEMENSAMGISESMSGRLLAKGDKYRMIVGDNVFISDGETVWNYLDDLYEIHINYVENMEGGLTPTALLENFEDEYRGKYIRQETHKGKTVNIIDLVPNTPQSFFKYRVAIDAADDMIIYTIAYDRHGGTYTYSLDKVRTNHNISDAVFVFNKDEFPSDIDIIDMR